MSTTTSNPTGAELLARIKPRLAEKGARICLRPDLLDAWQDAQEALEEAQPEAEGVGRLAGAGGTAKKPTAAARKLAEKVREIEAEIEANEIRFLFRAMPKHEWQTLCEENPPREGDQYDVYAGYNRVAVSDAQVRACLIDPVFEECDDKGCPHTACGTWQQFLSVCNPSEWAVLRNTAEEINGTAVIAAPKSLLASEILDKAGSTSAPRRRGA